MVAVNLLIISYRCSHLFSNDSIGINESLATTKALNPVQSVAVRFIALYLLLVGWGRANLTRL